MFRRTIFDAFNYFVKVNKEEKLTHFNCVRPSKKKIRIFDQNVQHSINCIQVPIFSQRFTVFEKLFKIVFFLCCSLNLQPKQLFAILKVDSF